MLSSALVCALLVALASSNPIFDTALDATWESYKTAFAKVYESEAEEIFRRTVWEENVRYIEKHNKEADLGLHTYRLGLNPLADLTQAEFHAQYLGTVLDATQRVQRAVDEKLLNVKVMAVDVDWRTKGYVTPVKDQGQCGSCWSFSATGSMEGQHFKATGNLVSLSEQNLMDCSFKYGNLGCNGGLMDQAFDYVIANKGVDTEASYPYETRDGTCRFKPANVGATISSYKDIPTGNETALAAAVATIGPISVAIDASHISFQLYHSGVYNERRCSSTQLDHGVLAVGYGSENNEDYWIVKNSWGASWGMKGYINMSRNKNNQCGIATSASYPLV